MTEFADESALWIETDQYGVIVDFSPAALPLINGSIRIRSTGFTATRYRVYRYVFLNRV
jgi:hypothetical protein